MAFVVIVAFANLLIMLGTLGFGFDKFEFDFDKFWFNCNTHLTVFHVQSTSHSNFPARLLMYYFGLEVYFFTFKDVGFDKIFK